MSDLVQNQIFTPNLIDNQFEEIPQQVVQPPNNSYLMNSYGNINIPQTPHYDPFGLLGSLNSLAPSPVVTKQTYSQNSLNNSANTNNYEENNVQMLTSTPKISSVPTLQIFPMPTSKISLETSPNLSLEPIPKISSSAIAQLSPVANSNVVPVSTNLKLTPIVKVKCKDTFAFMDTKKFVSGGIGKCIQLGEEWLTPNEFEKRSGSRSKKYLNSIKCQGLPLRFFVDNGELDSSGMKNVHKRIVPKTVQSNTPPVPSHVQTPIKIPNIHPDTTQAEEGIEGIVIETQSTLQPMANSETMPENLFHFEPKANYKFIDSCNQVENSSVETKKMSTSEANLEATSVTNSETLLETLLENEPFKTSAATSQVMLDNQPKIFKHTSIMNSSETNSDNSSETMLVTPLRAKAEVDNESNQIDYKVKSENQLKCQSMYPKEIVPIDQNFYSCKFCKKKYKTSNDLKYHETTHTSKKNQKLLNDLEHHDTTPVSKKLKMQSEIKVEVKPEIRPTKVQSKIESETESQSKVEIQSSTGEEIFPCDLCKNVFKTKKSLITHKKIHTWELPYKCGSCDMTFLEYYHLKGHESRYCMKTNQNHWLAKDELKKCETCDMKFNYSYELKIHERVHSDSLLKDPSKLMYNHNHWLANESLKSCENCDMKFKYQSDLKNHQRTHSEVFNPDIKLKAQSENYLENLIGDNTEPIKFAEKEFFTIENQIKNETENLYLKNHQRTHSGVFNPDIKLKTQSENCLKRLIGDNTEPEKDAEKEFSTVEDQIKNETKNIVLDLSVKKPEITDDSTKLSSMSKSFEENNLQPCEIVPAPKVETFSCNYCGKSFASRANLKRHEKIHTLSPLERSYPCNFCGIRYMNKHNAIKHQEQNCAKKGQPQDLNLLSQMASPDLNFENQNVSASSNTNEEEKLDTSQNESKMETESNIVQFEVQSNDEKMINENKPEALDHSNVNQVEIKPNSFAYSDKKFKCKFCIKTFKRKDNAKSHELIHTGERPFKCKFCIQTFKRKDTAKRHELTHTGEKEKTTLDENSTKSQILTHFESQPNIVHDENQESPVETQTGSTVESAKTSGKQSEAESETQLEAESNTQSEVQSEAESDTQSDAQSETKFEAEFEAKCDPHSETQSDAQADTQYDIQSDTQSEPESEAPSEAQNGREILLNEQPTRDHISLQISKVTLPDEICETPHQKNLSLLVHLENITMNETIPKALDLRLGKHDEDNKINYLSNDEDNKIKDLSIDKDNQINLPSINEDGQNSDPSTNEENQINEHQATEDNQINDPSNDKDNQSNLPNINEDNQVGDPSTNEKNQINDSRTTEKDDQIQMSRKKHPCKFCSRIFNHRYNLENHERIHTGEKPYPCKYCDKKFTQSYTAKRHERTHTGEKPYSCKYCDQRFTQSQTAKYHERTHTGEKPYACKHCDQRFTKSQSAKHHERAHTGEKPYSCKYCDIKFSQSQTAKRHERTHTEAKAIQDKDSMLHPIKFEAHVNLQQVDQMSQESHHVSGYDNQEILNDTKFEAESEEKSEPQINNRSINEENQSNDPSNNGKNQVQYASVGRDNQINDLTIAEENQIGDPSTKEENHISTDKDNQLYGRTQMSQRKYPCGVCSKFFSQKRNLVTHERIHTGEKPFACKYCGKRFSQSQSVKIHERTHTGERPYSCDDCGNRFRTNGSFRDHKKRCQKIDQKSPKVIQDEKFLATSVEF